MPLKEDELPSWSFFSRRRQLDVKLWLEQKSITSYESLVNHLTGIGIKPPTSKEVSRFFVRKDCYQLNDCLLINGGTFKWQKKILHKN